MAARGSRKRGADAPPVPALPLPTVAKEQAPERVDSPPAQRAGFIRCRVLGRVSAHGYVVEGHARGAWEPGDVGDFRPYVVDELPEHLERI